MSTRTAQKSRDVSNDTRGMCTTLQNEKDGKVMHPDLINPNIKVAQYAVRGELYLRGEQLRQEGKEIIFTNVGNPHSLGGKPLTFTRQVISLCTAPFLLDHPDVEKLFAPDAIARAKKLTASFKGGIGAYTDSRGNSLIREEISNFIQKRDGIPSNHNHVFMTDGASVSIRMTLNALIRNSNDGILVPIPQYPLYSASISLNGGALIPYYLDEDNAWGLDMPGLKTAVQEARAAGKNVRGMVFINPGNPTGQCLTHANLCELVKFAYDEKIVLMADEVYQENIYQDEHPFVSAKKAASDMGAPYNEAVELFSFHSISKGTGGECGLRGGYMEMVNIHPDTVAQMYKCASINLCPNTVGQIAVSVLVNPPAPGDRSYDMHLNERKAELQSLRQRAHMVTDAFNTLEGVSCNFTEGSMYSFPKITLSAKAIEKAKSMQKAPDVFYCLRLLETTGISTVPGSGFGQKEGTFHLRTTILPREEVMDKFTKLFKTFHESFMDEFRD
eukprot:gene5748-6041_t